MQKFLSKFYIILILNILREKMLYTFHLTKKTIKAKFYFINPNTNTLSTNTNYQWNFIHINILQT